MIGTLIWRNTWRNRRRTIITGSSVAFAVFLAILMQSFQTGIFGHLIQNVVGYYSGYIQIHKKGYWDEQVIENAFEVTDSLADNIRSTGVPGYVERMETFMLASTGETTKGVFLVGTDPISEQKMSDLSSKLISGVFLSSEGEEVIISQGLAQKLSLGVGDTLVLLGQGYHEVLAAGKYPICGLVKLASPDMNARMVYMPLKAARLLLNTENMATSISLILEDPGDMKQVSKALGRILDERYEVMEWEALMPEISNHIRSDRASFFIFTGILYLIIAFGFFSTMLMMLSERTFEMGMLIAIGLKKRTLAFMVAGELFLVTLGGALIGIALSIPLVWYLSAYPITLSGQIAHAYEQFGFDPVLPTTLRADIVLVQAMIVTCIAFLVSLYPYWHIKRMDAVTSMKK